MSTDIIMPEQRRQVTAPAAMDTSIMAVISRAASDPSCDINKLERLMEMHERMQAHSAKQLYDEALAQMQEEMPVIGERGGIKDKNGRIQSTYALWEDVNEMIKPVMAKHGFAITFRTPRNERGIEVEGVLSHRAGHREVTSIVLPVDATGNKNGVQAVASSVSYGKRYTAGLLLNITTTGEDDDGNGPAAQITPRVTSAQATQLATLLEKCSDKAKEAFKKIHGAPASVEKSVFDQVLGMLTKSAAQHAASQENTDADNH